MEQVTIGKNGELVVPPELRERYHLEPDVPVRLVETRVGILVIPLVGTLPQGLLQELADWQQLGMRAWEQFPYEDTE
ncbi:MAG: AbrB/MazE/SpoVT family DNA-binding domain-containing protein [Armatimonadota bacterium]